MSYETTKVPEYPKCDFCGKPAHYDGKVRGSGCWAYMCEEHFTNHGTGVGLGKGQRFELIEKTL